MAGGGAVLSSVPFPGRALGDPKSGILVTVLGGLRWWLLLFVFKFAVNIGQISHEDQTVIPQGGGSIWWPVPFRCPFSC